MKKFTFALVAAAFAVCANAATINWSAAKGYLYDGAGDSAAKLTSGTAYLVSTGYTQSDIVALFVSVGGDTSATLSKLQNDDDKKANLLGTGTVAGSAQIAGTGTTSATDSITAYFVVFNGGKMYVSATADTVYDGLAQSHDLSFTASMTKPSKATIDVGSGGSFSGAGWYAVPEPTTVALLALGLAAVGLKRKLA